VSAELGHTVGELAAPTDTGLVFPHHRRGTAPSWRANRSYISASRSGVVLDGSRTAVMNREGSRKTYLLRKSRYVDTDWRISD